MRTKITNKVRRLNSLKLWSAITGVALTVALVLTFLPMQVSVNTGGLLSIGLRTASAGPEIGEITSLRTQQTKTWYLGNGAYEVQSGLGPVHYQDNGWQEIDNAWVESSVQPWNYEMTKDDYHAYAYSLFTWGQIMKFERGGSSVAFQPKDLQWTNVLSQIESISIPQSVTATVDNQPVELPSGVNGSVGVLKWQNAYGPGRDFVWSATPGQLRPLLEIKSALPTPAQHIINGGGVLLRQSFIFAPSSGLDIYVNGQLWDKSSTVLTTQPIEFRSGGAVLWYFFPATGWSSNTTQEPPLITTSLRKVGSKLWLDVLVPYDFIQTSVYPIYIDPSVGPQPPGTAASESVLPEDDVTWGNYNNIKANDGAYATCALPKTKISYRLKATNFDFSAVPDGSTINGIVVEIERKGSLADVLIDFRVQLLDAAGALVGDNKQDYGYYATSDETITYGTPTNTWGASPTAAMVKDADFGVVMSTTTADLASTRTASVDFIRMTVYYTGLPTITNSQNTWAMGIAQPSDIKYFSADNNQDDDYSLITNTGSVAVDIQIQGQNIEGGSYDWVLASSAGSEQYSLYANSEATPTVYNIEVKSSSYSNLCTDLAISDTYSWSMKFTAPTAFNANDDGQQKGCNVTLVASAA